MASLAALADEAIQEHLRRCHVADMFPRPLRDSIERESLAIAWKKIGATEAEIAEWLDALYVEA